MGEIQITPTSLRTFAPILGAAPARRARGTHMAAKPPRTAWYQRRASLHVAFHCTGASGEPELQLCDESDVYVTWPPYELKLGFAKPVAAETAVWARVDGSRLTLSVEKKATGWWAAPFAGPKRSNVVKDLDNWMSDGEEEEVEAAAKEAKPKAAAADAPVVNQLAYRTTTKPGWKPLQKDWDAIGAPPPRLAARRALRAARRAPHTGAVRRTPEHATRRTPPHLTTPRLASQ